MGAEPEHISSDMNLEKKSASGNTAKTFFFCSTLRFTEWEVTDPIRGLPFVLFGPVMVAPSRRRLSSAQRRNTKQCAALKQTGAAAAEHRQNRDEACYGKTAWRQIRKTNIAVNEIKEDKKTNLKQKTTLTFR